jgi:hypothetical protein
MRDQNIESFENMRENLISNNINPDTIPILLQLNKRDLNHIMGIDAFNQDLNRNGTYEVLEAVATDGKGVEETFKKITRLLLKDISRKHKIEIQLPEEKKKSVSPIKPAPEASPEPVKQDIFPEEHPFKSALSEPKIPQISGIGSSVAMPCEEEIELVPEEESFESGPVEEIQPVKGIDVPKQIPDAAPASPEFTEETVVPEYEIDNAELIEEIEPLRGIDLQKSFPDAAPAFPEFVEETMVPDQEEPVEQSIPIFPEMAETEPAREIPREAVRPFPMEKSDELSDTVRDLSEKMVRMTDTITLLRQTVSDLRTEVKALQYNIIPKKERAEKASEFKDSNEFKELKRDQKEIADLIKHIAYMMSSLKEKKSWFKFKF